MHGPCTQASFGLASSAFVYYTTTRRTVSESDASSLMKMRRTLRHFFSMHAVMTYDDDASRLSGGILVCVMSLAIYVCLLASFSCALTICIFAVHACVHVSTTIPYRIYIRMQHSMHACSACVCLLDGWIMDQNHQPIYIYRSAKI
jgi:hypothetical protein